MADRDESEKANGDVPEVPAGASGEPPSVSDIKSAPLSTLPAVESPPLLPDENPERETPPVAAEAAESAAPAVEPPSAEEKPQTLADETAPSPAARTFRWPSLTRRQRRNALRAATIAFALFASAGYGMILGGGFATREQAKDQTQPQPDTAAIAERKALQQQIAALSKQVATLKTDLDRANKSTQSKIAKIAGRLDATPPATAAPAPAPAQPAAPEITGSVPQTKAAVADVPLPLPRPAPQIAAAQAAAPTNGRTVVQGWSIRDVIDGYIYVQNRGEIFEVVPGVPLPGLGRVRSVRREDGRWIVETPRGIIVAQRDRRHFE